MKKVFITLASVIVALSLSTQNLKAQDNNTQSQYENSYYGNSTKALSVGAGFHLSLDFFNPNKDLNGVFGIKTKGFGYGAGFCLSGTIQRFTAYLGFDFNHSSSMGKESSYHIYTPKMFANISYSFALDNRHLFWLTPHIGIGHANNILALGDNVKLDHISITDAKNATSTFSQVNWFIPVGLRFTANNISVGLNTDIPIHNGDVHPFGSKDTKVKGVSAIKSLPVSLTIGVDF